MLPQYRPLKQKKPAVNQRCLASLIVIITLLTGNAFATELYFDKPGSDWESMSLPLGNGHIGATLLGHTVIDRIQFNEKTLWTGGPNSKEQYNYGFLPDAENYLDKLKAIQQELNTRGELSPEAVAEQLGQDQTGYGSYQSFGDLVLQFPDSHHQYSDYKRALNLDTAIAKVSYQSQGVQYVREYFVSYPDNSLIIRLTANKPHQLHFSAAIALPKNRSAQVINLAENRLAVTGKLHDNQLEFAALLTVEAIGGEISQNSKGIRVESADSVVLRLTAATNYQLQHPEYRAGDAFEQAKQQDVSAAQFNYQQLKTRHLNDYQAFYHRVHLDIGQSQSIAVDHMLAAYPSSDKTLNRTLEHLYYQYGRYLLIASSRKGSLPANLQGIWNKDIQAPWSADYHLNINLQMNYWLADMTNLAETLPPLFDYLENLTIPGEFAASSMFSSPGWVVFLNSNPWGSTGLIKWPTAFWQPEAAAWMSLHFFDHYLYQPDRQFLANRAYPIMRSASEFWLHNLIQDPKTKRLTVTPSYSPEHGNFTAGAAMSQQIVVELFSKTLLAAEELNDHLFVSRLEKALSQLDSGLRIGSWGQLQEWRQDRDDRSSHHRHVSHLFALHPATQISPLTTPELAEAAKVTLNARGDGGTGWSKAWKINFWARLHDGDRAHKLLAEQLQHSTLDNLWSNHPPFQIDGNFGATSGMTEMLLQSQLNQAYQVHLLPALPADWPSGEVKGLKAKGDITVDIKWHDSALTHAQLYTANSTEVQLRNPVFNREFRLMLGNQSIEYQRLGQDTIRFSSVADSKYEVVVGNN